jgi:beta-xylosidase
VEGPHIYGKDGYYYLLVAEGSGQINHAATIARSKTLNGTWESSPHNPLVSNNNTDQYFQTVGQANLFQDVDRNWWGVALTSRGGPILYNKSIFPMGRETALYSVSWPQNGWPVAEQVRGEMIGPLPPSRRAESLSDIGLVVGKAGKVDFERKSGIPEDWLFYRAPFDASSFKVSLAGHSNTLRITSSRENLTSDSSFNASLGGVNAVFRRQEHTYFNYTVDLNPCFGKNEGYELGVLNFLDQFQHVDLGNGKLQPNFWFRAESICASMPSEIVTLVPKTWLSQNVCVRIS